MPPVDPKNGASPKLKIPPSAATNQYPFPDGVAAIPTIGWFSASAPVEPRNAASPKLKIPPSAATNQYPWPERVDAAPTTGRASPAAALVLATRSPVGPA